MEKTAMKQVWSNGYSYSFNGESRSKIGILSPPLISPNVNGTNKMKRIEKSSSSSSTDLISLCGIILSLVFLNLVIILRDFYSSFHCLVSILKSFLRIASCIWTTTATARRPIEKSCSICYNIDHADDQIKQPRDQTETDDHQNDSLLELKKMINGISLSNMGSCCETQKNLSADKIAGIFEEEEPSLKEVKEAFDIFDENKDGFIDAKELGNVLFSLGFMEASEDDCKKMIKGFDDNLDGRIDFNEFIEVVEKSLF
ncbi:hypothetical protein DITRI_Ditri04bG0049100 [Diplodiscus trichospermus]